MLSIASDGTMTALREGETFVTGNYRSRRGEIDIIVRDDEYIVFVEVKTRNEHSLASPSEFIDTRKQQRMLTTAKLYLTAFPTPLQPRFDAVEVIYHSMTGAVLSVQHMENILQEWS